MRILIIDDDEDIREVLGLVLRSIGHDVDEAVDGLDALARLRAGEPPALILLDLTMPRLDGEGLMALLRRDPQLADLPVWILSGHPAARDRARALGATECLVKPIELDRLLSLLRQFSPGMDARP